jgi:hypothetical protein
VGAGINVQNSCLIITVRLRLSDEFLQALGNSPWRIFSASLIPLSLGSEKAGLETTSGDASVQGGTYDGGTSRSSGIRGHVVLKEP